MTKLVLALSTVALLLGGGADARPKKKPAPRATPFATSPAPADSPMPTGAGSTVSAPAPDLSLHPLAPSGETRCILCHTVKGWDDVQFAHDRTGFPLKGMHRQVGCKDCHASDFRKAIPDRCSACHHDPHAQEFGLYCEGCHDEKSWRTQFNADAHRATNFPLTGRHAVLPCTECHRQSRDRGFSRAVVDCAGCHLADYQRAALTSIDHAAAGFSTACQQCHAPWRFSPARFPQHDRCFRLARGPHASIKCLTCHTSLSMAQASGACATGTAACTSCHEHECIRTDSIHAACINDRCMGYQCKDQKCSTCHQE